MRSCMYCGRELETGEVCTCAQSAAHRARKSQDTKSKTQDNKENYRNPYRTQTTYTTGYSASESRFKRAQDKRRARRAAKKADYAKTGRKNFFRDLGVYILEFMKSPIDKIARPPHIGKGAILSVAAVMGAVLWLCMLFIMRGGNAGPLKFIGSIIGFSGKTGYSYVSQVIACIVMGALSGIVIFLLYSGVFFLINRFIFKLQTPFWEFSIRLISAWIPFTVICAVGSLLSILSPLTLLTLLICGAASVAVLTYEALRTEWISRTAGKVVYAMMLGYFIFFTLVCYLINI